MKIYITFKDDGWNGEEIEKVYLHKEDAIEVELAYLVSHGFYKDEDDAYRREAAENLVREYNVVEKL